jgi:hypothetical protein
VLKKRRQELAVEKRGGLFEAGTNPAGREWQAAAHDPSHRQNSMPQT